MNQGERGSPSVGNLLCLLVERGLLNVGGYDMCYQGGNGYRIVYTQRRVQPDQCYFTVYITRINFECNLWCNSTFIVCIALLLHII